jgi:hypothetical protein
VPPRLAAPASSSTRSTSGTGCVLVTRCFAVAASACATTCAYTSMMPCEQCTSYVPCVVPPPRCLAVDDAVAVEALCVAAPLPDAPRGARLADVASGRVPEAVVVLLLLLLADATLVVDVTLVESDAVPRAGLLGSGARFFAAAAAAVTPLLVDDAAAAVDVAVRAGGARNLATTSSVTSASARDRDYNVLAVSVRAHTRAHTQNLAVRAAGDRLELVEVHDDGADVVGGAERVCVVAHSERGARGALLLGHQRPRRLAIEHVPHAVARQQLRAHHASPHGIAHAHCTQRTSTAGWLLSGAMTTSGTHVTIG